MDLISEHEIRVLLIADDFYFRQSAKEVLEESELFQFLVIEASSLDLGTSLSYQYKPDVLLLDLNLPDSLGLATLEHFITHFSSIPVVACGVLNHHLFFSEVIRTGAQDYLFKDSREVDFLPKILTNAVSRHKMRQELEDKVRQLNKVEAEITQQNQALLNTQQQLKESEEKYRSLFTYAPVGGFTLNQEETVIEANLKGAELFACDPHQLRGRPFSDLVSTESRHRLRHLLDQVGSGLRARDEMKLANGQQSTVWMEILPVLDDRSNILFSQVILTDITALKQAQSALHLQHQLLRTIIDLVPHLILARDAQGRFVLSNQAHANFLNLPVHQVEGHLMQEVAPHLICPELQEQEQLLISRNAKRLDVEEHLVDANNQARVFQTIKIPLEHHEQAEVLALSVSVDITELKQAQERLEKESDFIRTVLNTVGALIMVLNPSLEIVHFNKAFEDLTGLFHDEVQHTKRWKEFLNFKDLNYFLSQFNDSGANPFRLEKQDIFIRTHANQFSIVTCTCSRMLSKSGKLEYIILCGMDRTDHKLIEAELSDNRAMLAQIIDLVPLPIYALDSQEKLILVNKEVEQLLGRNRNELIGLHPNVLNKTHEPMRNLFPELDEVLEQGKAQFIQKQPFIDAQDNYRIFETTLIPFYARHGQDVSVLGVAVDITEFQEQASHTRQQRKDLQVLINQQSEELKTAYQQVKEAADRQRDFYQEASHEMRTPLTVISQYLRFLQRGIKCEEPTQQQASHLQLVEKNTQQLMRLITDMLDHSRLQAGKLEINLNEVNLNQVIENTLERIHTVLVSKSEVKLVRDLVNPLPPVQANQERLEQVISNLLTNAFKFTHQGEVRIKTEWLVPKGQVRLTVSDTGMGMTNNQINNVFERFSRLGQNEEIEGSGLGLTIAQALVHRMGSAIQVRSQPGKGSEFFFQLKVFQRRNA